MTPRNGKSRKLWLMLLREGGRMSAAELARGLEVKPNEIKAVLASMAQNGTVTHYPRSVASRRVSYGITNANKVPLELTIDDLLQNGFQMAPEAQQ